ncbi:CBS domain-containing protein [Ekhidna sp.]|uniref:CBS domain-containing protein n=1 Tax=Ekhidna sp. TaxID=2608089 RepID=UPI003CCB97A4
MKTRPISEIMTKQVHYIDINDPVINARNLMDKYEIHHLPVMESGKLVGMLSSNDIKQVQYLCDFIGERLEESTVFKSLSIEELMTEKVQSLTTNATTVEAAQVFSNVSFQSLPILENDELVGIVTTKDIFTAFLTEN